MGKSEAPKLPLPPSGGVGLHSSPALSLACRQRRCWCAASNVTMVEVQVLSVGTLGTLPSRRFEQASALASAVAELAALVAAKRLSLVHLSTDTNTSTLHFQEFHPPNALSCRVN